MTSLCDFCLCEDIYEICGICSIKICETCIDAYFGYDEYGNTACSLLCLYKNFNINYSPFEEEFTKHQYKLLKYWNKKKERSDLVKKSKPILNQYLISNIVSIILTY